MADQCLASKVTINLGECDDTAILSMEDKALEIDNSASIVVSKYSGVTNEIPNVIEIQSTDEGIGKEFEVEADASPLSENCLEPEVNIGTALPWENLSTSLQSVLPNGKNLRNICSYKSYPSAYLHIFWCLKSCIRGYCSR